MVTPAAVAAVADVPAPSVSSGGSATVNAATATATIPAPLVSGESNATVTEFVSR